MRWFKRYPNAALLLVIVLLLAMIYMLQGRIRAARVKGRIVRSTPLVGTRVSEDVLSWAMGWAIAGFRQVGVTIAWLELDNAKERRDYFEYRMLCDWISYLQPEIESVWAYNSWNLAYNISVMAESKQEGWRWVQEGIRIAKRGVRRKPLSSNLYRHLAWIYYDKCAGQASDPTSRSAYYKKMVIETTGIHPYQHVINIMTHAWKIDRCGRAVHARMIPYSYRALSVEAALEGDLDKMKHYRLKAIKWFEDIADAYHTRPDRDDTKKRIDELRLRLRGYDAEADAAKASRDGNTELEMKFIEKAYNFWIAVFKADELGKEPLSRLKGILARYEKALSDEKDPEAAAAILEKITTTWLLLQEKYRLPEKDIDKALASLSERHKALAIESKDAGDLDAARRHARSLGALTLGLYRRQRPDEISAPLVKGAARLQMKLAERIRAAGKDEQADSLLLEAAELWRALFERNQVEEDGKPILQKALKHYERLEKDASAKLLEVLMREADLDLAILNYTNNASLVDTTILDRAIVMRLLPKDGEDTQAKTPKDILTAMKSRADSELRRLGKADVVDRLKKESADLHRELAKMPKDANPMPRLVKLIDNTRQAEKEASREMFDMLMKQIDMHMELMGSKTDAELHEKALKAIAERCVDVYLYEKETEMDIGGRWYRSAVGTYTYFLEKNPSDEVSLKGWDRLYPEKEDTLGAKPRRPAPPEHVGATWVVYLFFIVPLFIGLAIAYSLRRRKMGHFSKSRFRD